MDSNNVYSYLPCQASHSRPFCQAPSLPTSQAFFPSDTSPLDNNGIDTGRNEQLNIRPYGYVENNGNRINYSTMNYGLTNDNRVNYSTMNHGLINNNSPFITQTSGQTQSTSTFSNNESMTANTAHGNVIIIIKSNINLEKLLSIIQQCEREESIYIY